MPIFNAKTQDELHGNPAAQPKPGEEAPYFDDTAFGLVADGGSALHRTFTYATRKHTLDEITTPGYFGASRRSQDARDFGIKVWDVIECTIGTDPETAIEVPLRVASIGTSREEPVVVAVGEVKKYKPTVKPGGKSKAA